MRQAYTTGFVIVTAVLLTFACFFWSILLQ